MSGSVPPMPFTPALSSIGGSPPHSLENERDTEAERGADREDKQRDTETDREEEDAVLAGAAQLEARLGRVVDRFASAEVELAAERARNEKLRCTAFTPPPAPPTSPTQT